MNGEDNGYEDYLNSTKDMLETFFSNDKFLLGTVRAVAWQLINIDFESGDYQGLEKDFLEKLYKKKIKEFEEGNSNNYEVLTYLSSIFLIMAANDWKSEDAHKTFDEKNLPLLPFFGKKGD